MRKFAVVLLAVGLAQTAAFGGVVSFDPNPVSVDVGVGDSPVVKLDVFIEQLGDISNQFGSFDIVFGAGVIADGDTSGLTMVGWEWDTDLFQRQAQPPGINPDQASSIYLDDIKVGFFVNFGDFPSLGPIDTTNPVRIGSLTVDTTGLEDGKYEVVVDFTRDNTSFAVGGISDPGNSLLFGAGSVNVVPEPATISLLGLASLALIRRRREA